MHSSVFKGFALLTAAMAASTMLAGAVMAQSARPSPSDDPRPLWSDATAETTGVTGEWTNKVEVADIDGDGLLDILHANGGDYESPGTPARQGVYLNTGASGAFTDVSDGVFGDERFLARVIKARDVTGDGIIDLLVGTTYQTQSHLYAGLGGGAFEDATDVLLPRAALSVGDLEVGDVDDDRDLDIVLADWGPGSPMGSPGGPVRLWRNTGQGFMADVGGMPGDLIRFSWDLELVDVDLDWDLDVVVSCKMCPTNRLYLNDGSGMFTDATADRLPGFSGNYEFEAMDLDGDGDPELMTINPGPSSRELVLRNDAGVFVDATADWWPTPPAPGFDDNVAVFLDADSDDDADFLIGSLNGPDRLMLNDGTGHLTMHADVFEGLATGGTLGLALGDLDGDRRIDVVEGEGETADADHVFLATDALAPDTAGPSIDEVHAFLGASGRVEVRARIHDRKTPVLRDDFGTVSVSLAQGGDGITHDLEWYGDTLWRASLGNDGILPPLEDIQVCATDRAGNETCAP